MATRLLALARRVALGAQLNVRHVASTATLRHGGESCGSSSNSNSRDMTELDVKVQDLIRTASERVPFVFPEDAVKLHSEGECTSVPTSHCS
jgi:hypothetical protein